MRWPDSDGSRAAESGSGFTIELGGASTYAVRLCRNDSLRMAMLTLISVVASIFTLIGGVAAVIAVRQAKQQAARADSATSEAIQVAARLAMRETILALTPQYDIAIQTPNGYSGGQPPEQLHLLVTFTGPAELDHLDRLVVALDPDRLSVRRRAPYRFHPGARPRANDTCAGSEGLVIRCQRVEGGEQLRFLLGRTAAANRRVRLAITLDAYRLGNDLALPAVAAGTLHWSRVLVLGLDAVAS